MFWSYALLSPPTTLLIFCYTFATLPRTEFCLSIAFDAGALEFERITGLLLAFFIYSFSTFYEFSYFFGTFLCVGLCNIFKYL